jgi:hypothetical protein
MYYSDICLERLRKAMKSFNQDGFEILNSGSYEEFCFLARIA